MGWTLTSDLDEFTGTAGQFLRSRPVEHTVLLTLIDTSRRRGPHAYGVDDPIFGWWRTSSGSVCGVLVQTPPYPMMFSDVLAEAVRTRMSRLGTLTPPTPMPPGAARTAGPADRELVVRWMRAFLEFIGEHHGSSTALADDRLVGDGVTLWEVDGTPVSLVARSRPEAGMVRIQNVYTPAESRGHGYAAAATRAAQQAGATEIVLVTDQANPTSNALYQRLGYQPLEDRTVVEFA
ncbi:GNAT family N-acetyltransferase [Micromonosporaceae bacterium Da 78-11]